MKESVTLEVVLEEEKTAAALRKAVQQSRRNQLRQRTIQWDHKISIAG